MGAGKGRSRRVQTRTTPWELEASLETQTRSAEEARLNRDYAAVARFAAAAASIAAKLERFGTTLPLNNKGVAAAIIATEGLGNNAETAAAAEAEGISVEDIMCRHAICAYVKEAEGDDAVVSPEGIAAGLATFKSMIVRLENGGEGDILDEVKDEYINEFACRHVIAAYLVAVGTPAPTPEEPARVSF